MADEVQKLLGRKESYRMKSAHSIQRSTSQSSSYSDSISDTLSESKKSPDLGSEWDYILNKNAGKRTTHATNNVDTFVHLLKGNIGTGLLALPYATMEAGYILGPLGIFVFGVLATHCMIILVDSARSLCKDNNISSLDYSETMQFAVRKVVAKRSVPKVAKAVVNGFLMITQFGFCSVYFVFMAKSLQQIFVDMYCLNIDFRFYVLIILLPVIIFSWIRNLDTLASLSGLANICIIVGLAIVLYDEVTKLVINGHHEAAVKEGHLHLTGKPLRLAMFFGTTVFAYEAIGVVLPLENKMRNPEHAKRVIYLGMGSVTVLNTIFGLLGYLVYGSDTKASVTLNLCGSNAGTAFVFSITKALFAINIFVSYLIQFYVPLDFLEPYVYKLCRIAPLQYSNEQKYERLKSVIQCVFRATMVLFTAVLAVSIPDLGDLITLVGAGASSCLAFIFPPLIEMLTFGKSRDRKWAWIVPWPLWIVKDVLIMLVGVTGFCFGSFAAINSIIHTLSHKEPSIGCDEDGIFQTICHLVEK